MFDLKRAVGNRAKRSFFLTATSVDKRQRLTLIGTIFCFPSSEACLQGWVQFQSDCYLLIEDDTKDWYKAEIDCLSRNSDLVYILTAEEEQFIDSQLINKTTIYEAFVGLKESNDRDVRFSLWSNGDNIDYTNWQVNTTAAHLEGTACVAKNRSGFGQWTIVDCFEKKPYICKRRGMYACC